MRRTLSDGSDDAVATSSLHGNDASAIRVASSNTLHSLYTTADCDTRNAFDDALEEARSIRRRSGSSPASSNHGSSLHQSGRVGSLNRIASNISLRSLVSSSVDQSSHNRLDPQISDSLHGYSLLPREQKQERDRERERERNLKDAPLQPLALPTQTSEEGQKPMLVSKLSTYYKRWLGPPGHQVSPVLNQLVSRDDLVRSLLGSFCGILVLASISLSVAPSMLPFILGSNGASAVLVYGLPHLKPSQPRAVIFGNLLSAFIGVSIRMLVVEAPQCESCRALAAALSVSFSTVAMHVTGTVYPPGGATALIAVIGGPDQDKLGFMFLVFPVLASSVILLFVALIINNLFGLSSADARERGYPNAWC